MKFPKKYFNILNTQHQSIVHTDHELLVAFLNAEYHENIFAFYTNKLYLLNIDFNIFEGKKS